KAGHDHHLSRTNSRGRGLAAKRGRHAVKSIALKVGLVVASVGIALLILELVLGRGTPREGAPFFEDPPDGLDVPWVLKAGSDEVFEGHYVTIAPTRVRISDQGVREDREYAVPKPAETRRILMLGDSFVFGSGVEAAETFSDRFEVERGDLEVINMGVPGYNSGHAVALLEARGISFEPDGVVLFLSDNDFYNQGKERLREREAQGERWAAERYVEGRVKARNKADGQWRRDPAVALGAIADALKRLRELSEKHGFKVQIFMLFPHPLEREITAMGGVTRLADAAYLKDMKALQIPKDLHPNAAGHARLARLLIDALPGWPADDAASKK
ncbi:MAG: hypothetical protein ACI9WU_004307, partial [Myxococcota bacterium]